jgi:hypothetical protein
MFSSACNGSRSLRPRTRSSSVGASPSPGDLIAMSSERST